MFRSLYTAATGMHAQETRMSVIANNLANQGTVGFKKSRAEFEELLSEKIRPAAAPNPSHLRLPESRPLRRPRVWLREGRACPRVVHRGIQGHKAG